MSVLFVCSAQLIVCIYNQNIFWNNLQYVVSVGYILIDVSINILKISPYPRVLL